MVRLIVSGTPVAMVVDEPKLERMSLRTTPLSASTSGPFDSSLWNGPAVSSGMTAQLAPTAAVPAALAPAEAPAVAPLGPHPMIVNNPTFRPAKPRPFRT